MTSTDSGSVMAAAKVSPETVFLREFADTYVGEIAITEPAMADLRQSRVLGYHVGLADVLYVLKTGVVTTSEKEEAEGAKWRVEGSTCHGEKLIISTQVWCDRYQVRVLRVALMGVSYV